MAAAGSVGSPAFFFGGLAILLALIALVQTRSGSGRNSVVKWFAVVDILFLLQVLWFLASFPISLPIGHGLAMFFAAQVVAGIGCAILWPDGERQADGEMRDGQKHGRWYVYRDNGKLAATEHYQNGELTERTEYDEHGRVRPDAADKDADDAERD